MLSLEEVCLHHGYVDESQLREAWRRQKETRASIGEILVELGYLTDEQLAEALSIQLDLPFCRPLDLNPSPDILAVLTPRQAEKFRVIPIAFDGEHLTLATAEPLALELLDQLRDLVGYKIRLAVTSKSQIDEALKKYYGGSLESVAALLEDLDESELDRYRSEALSDVNSIVPETMVNEAPIIRLVNTIITGAVKAGASDIHLEPFEDEVKIRYRVDGVLQETHSPPKSLYPAIISRIKLMGGMDITERRMPQDGRIRLRLEGRDLDLRVAVAPTLYGEEAVIRILNRESMMLSLEQLGFSQVVLEKFSQLIAKPHGMILITGPTGSGKTTTLYAALQKLNESTRKIITLEDPIEYQLKGVTQMQVQPKLGFTFAQGLRTIVRHDPDIILVGEIRDRETAELAVQSALTGHLVFATLHTNDAPTAFTRLIDMGIEEFLVASTVRGVLAQRLVRRVCPACKTPHRPTPQEKELLGLDGSEMELFSGTGCEHCNYIGYRGQIGLFEMLITTEAIERLIIERSSSGRIREVALQQGMTSLREDGVAKVKSGLTTLAEVLRVTRD